MLAAGAAATIVTLWPGGQQTTAHRTPVSTAASTATGRAISPTVIHVTASARQYGQIRAIEAWLTSHAAWLRRPVTLAVTVPPPPPVPKPAAPAQQVAPVVTGTAPVSSGAAQQIALGMLASYGWSASQFGCLDALWAQESGWNVYAANPDGAYGIPQALPGSKMASAGPDWQTDAATQIRWGLSYIQATYGSPCAAWSHEEATGWY